MIRVQVWMKPEAEYNSRTGQFLIVETADQSFAAFVRRVDDDALISGEILITRRDYDGNLAIVQRTPLAFRGAVVDRCQPNTRELVEGREAA